jgi:ABC-type antimicrobial peptide transport system permease subunit
LLYLPARDLVTGASLAAAMGLLSGLVPAWSANRLRVVDALRRA